ncbi:hypothetical protein CJ030_MR0G007455 [Morella rubra]|uniref:Reverse transcriptase zinc-binding domain-containing protein n=1 Tax=Morella rubra TaxID=262757 RepID=A0A6A1UJF4_9ROSI|nr:hypothetical protein CJ030_MR0G007455 [Morella rubra]
MQISKETWEKLWKCKIQDRLKLMLWKVGAGALKTRGGLGRILQCEESEEFLCPLRRNVVEDSIHLLVHCDVAGQAWRESMWPIQMDRIPLSSPISLVLWTLVGEAFAMAEAATLAKKRKWTRVILESD